LNSSVYSRRFESDIWSSDFGIVHLRRVSTKSGEVQGYFIVRKVQDTAEIGVAFAIDIAKYRESLMQHGFVIGQKK